MQTTLSQLLEAKRLSDAKRYRLKSQRLADLLRNRGKEFEVEFAGRLASIRHPSTGFQIHTLSSTVPSEEAGWRAVSKQARQIVDSVRDQYTELRLKAAAAPLDAAVLLQPESGEVHVNVDYRTPKEKMARLQSGFPGAMIAPHGLVPNGYPAVGWIWIKSASDPILSTLASVTNFQPGSLNTSIAGPSPLAALLASGVLGAGVGYGVGSIAESVLPRRHFERGTLSRNAALLGAGIAASPSLLWALTNYQADPQHAGTIRSLLSSWPHGQAVGLDKTAAIDQGLFASATLPTIPKDEFNRVVWQDNRTPLAIRAATSGLVDAAADVSNRDVLSPLDIARVTATGAVNGLIVGKTLGALAGLRPEAQNSLQQVGIWGSVLSAVVPNAWPRFGGQS
jgi:hypothetical protein